MTDPPGRNLAEHAPGDGGGGGTSTGTTGGAERSEHSGTRTVSYELTSDHGDGWSDSDFVTFRSRNSRRKAASKNKNNHQDAPTQRTSRVSNKHEGAKANGKQRARQQSGAQRGGLTPFDRKVFQLRDWLRRGSETSIIIELFAAVQRLWRTEDEEASITFTEDYHADDSIDCSALHDKLHQLLAGRNSSTAKFTKWLETARLRVTQRVSPADEQGEQARTANAWQRRPAGTWQPRPLTKAEQDFLHHRVPGGLSRSPDQPLDTASRLILQAAAETSQQVTLVGQLDGTVSLAADMSFRGLLGIISDITPTLAVENAKLRRAIARLWYEPDTNRLHFVLNSFIEGQYWAGKSVPILRRPVMLRRVLPPGQPPSPEYIDLSLYHVQICNLGGNLTVVDVWHLFSSLLHLDVAGVDPVGPDSDGVVDPTRMNVSIRSRGCPLVLLDKTCIKWIEQVVWIHHVHFKVTPPCVICASPTHLAKHCTTGSSRIAEHILHVKGTRLQIDDECLQVKSAMDLEHMLRITGVAVANRSAMAGEDFDAPDIAVSIEHFHSIPNMLEPRGKRAQLEEAARAQARRRRFTALRQHVLEETNIFGCIRLWELAVADDPKFPDRTHRWRLPAPIEDSDADRLQRFVRAATPIRELPRKKKAAKQAEAASAGAVEPGEVGTDVGRSQATAQPSANTFTFDEEQKEGAEPTPEPADEDMADVENQGAVIQLSGSKRERAASGDGEGAPETLLLGTALEPMEELDAAVKIFWDSEVLLAMCCPPRKSLLVDLTAFAHGFHPTAAIVQALQAVISTTHGLGNCLSVAVVEGLVNATWVDLTAQSSASFELVLRDFKELVYQAFIKDVEQEAQLCYRDSIHEQISASLNRVEAYTAYMKRFRHSACDAESVVPNDSWGGSDVIRMFVKAVGIKIYVIQHNADPRLCAYLIYERFTFPNGFPTGMHRAMPLAEWIVDLGAQLRLGTRPVVLVHTANHYAAVIFPQAESDQRSAKRSALVRAAEAFPAPRVVDPFASVEAIDLTDDDMEADVTTRTVMDPGDTGEGDQLSVDGPPLELSHHAQMARATIEELGGDRKAELLAFLAKTQLSPLEPEFQRRLDERVVNITREDLEEFARQRGDTSIEGALHVIVTRLHAQLLDEQEAEQDSRVAAPGSSDSSFQPDSSSAAASDSDLPSDHDMALASGFHPSPPVTARMSAAEELHRLLRQEDGPDVSLAQLLASPKAEEVAFQDLKRWIKLFSRLNHNLDFITALYPPLRARWSLQQLGVIKLEVLRFAIGQGAESDVCAELVEWEKEQRSAEGAQLLALQSDPVCIDLLVERLVPPMHRGWVRHLFGSQGTPELLRAALICGILAASPHRPGDLLHWAAVLFDAVATSETTRRFLVEDSLQGGLLALLEWVTQHEQVTASQHESARLSWNGLGLARTRL